MPSTGEQMRNLQIAIHQDPAALGKAAADSARQIINEACSRNGSATLVIATGSSQIEVLSHLKSFSDIPWHVITVFHLDEYIGLEPHHPASFRKFLHDRFIDLLPNKPKAFHEINGLADPEKECQRLAKIVPDYDFDLAMVGIGENAHLAFNDPPADFEIMEPYIMVKLDKRCRQQQVWEGWFPSITDVPTHAISMSIARILASRTIICSVPSSRKAEAVQATMEGDISPNVPASVLQRHSHCFFHLDQDAASHLQSRTRNDW